VWRAVSARGRFGVDVETRYRSPFIGRDLDLATVKTAYQRALRDSSLQMVTVVGEPGVGKSRLLAEFASYVDEQEELVTWRQGRSLPYGEGITFWALGEIVKAQAGINFDYTSLWRAYPISGKTHPSRLRCERTCQGSSAPYRGFLPDCPI